MFSVQSWNGLQSSVWTHFCRSWNGCRTVLRMVAGVLRTGFYSEFSYLDREWIGPMKYSNLFRARVFDAMTVLIRERAAINKNMRLWVVFSWSFSSNFLTVSCCSVISVHVPTSFTVCNIRISSQISVTWGDLGWTFAIPQMCVPSAWLVISSNF